MKIIWIKGQYFVYGVVVGAFAGILTFVYLMHWVSPDGAERLAEARAEAAVIVALAPVCAHSFMAQDGALEKRETLAQAAPKDRKELFYPPWVTLPGRDAPDARLANACANILLRGTKDGGA